MNRSRISIPKTPDIIRLKQSSLFKESVYSVIKKFKRSRELSLYQPIISFLKQRPPPSKLCCHWLAQLCDLVPLLDKDTEPIILDTLKIDWQHGDENIEAHIFKFVSSLVTAHNYFASPILELLFTKLIPVLTENDSVKLGLNSLHLSKEQRGANTKIVKLIQNITSHVPLCSKLLVKIARNASPYFKRHAHMHVVFTYTLLQLMTLMPDLRRNFLEIIFNNLITLDLYSPRKELDVDSDAESDDGSEDMFSMDVDNENLEPKHPATKHPIGHTLDSLMTLMFRFIHFTTHGGENLENILDSADGCRDQFTTNGCRAGVAWVCEASSEAPPTNEATGEVSLPSCAGMDFDGETPPPVRKKRDKPKSFETKSRPMLMGRGETFDTPPSLQLGLDESYEAPPLVGSGRGDKRETPPTNGCECRGNSLDLNALRTLYIDLKETFSKLILPTHSTSHPQFLIFYLLSLRPTLVSDFLDFLKNIFVTPGNAPEARKIAISCLGSILTRARYIRFSHVHYCLGIIRSWCKSYLQSEHAESNRYEDLQLHHQFYCACQAIFYVFTFKYRDYTGSKARLKLAHSLHLDELIVSPLNPLRFCSQTIYLNFAAVTCHYQLAYCYTILKRNCRLFLPVQNSIGSFDRPEQALDAIFPFDPYLLKRSDLFICENYREFEGLPEDILRHSVNLNSNHGKEDENEEEHIDEDDIFGGSPESLKFSYKFSPGFKNF